MRQAGDARFWLSPGPGRPGWGMLLRSAFSLPRRRFRMRPLALAAVFAVAISGAAVGLSAQPETAGDRKAGTGESGLYARAARDAWQSSALENAIDLQFARLSNQILAGAALNLPGFRESPRFTGEPGQSIELGLRFGDVASGGRFGLQYMRAEAQPFVASRGNLTVLPASADTTLRIEGAFQDRFREIRGQRYGLAGEYAWFGLFSGGGNRDSGAWLDGLGLGVSGQLMREIVQAESLGYGQSRLIDTTGTLNLAVLRPDAAADALRSIEAREDSAWLALGPVYRLGLAEGLELKLGARFLLGGLGRGEQRIQGAEFSSLPDVSGGAIGLPLPVDSSVAYTTVLEGGGLYAIELNYSLTDSLTIGGGCEYLTFARRVDSSETSGSGESVSSFFNTALSTGNTNAGLARALAIALQSDGGPLPSNRERLRRVFLELRYSL